VRGMKSRAKPAVDPTKRVGKPRWVTVELAPLIAGKESGYRNGLLAGPGRYYRACGRVLLGPDFPSAAGPAISAFIFSLSLYRRGGITRAGRNLRAHCRPDLER